MEKKITNGILSVVLAAFIITFSVVATLNFRQLFYFDVDNLNIPAMSGMTREDIISNYDSLISYNSMLNSGKLEFPTLAMSPEGEIHFEEVKNIFVGIQVTLLVSLVLLLGGIIYKSYKREWGFLKIGAIITVVTPTVLGAMVATNWQWFFVAFHKLAFRNDYWIFDPIKDPVITMLPDAFFMHCAIMILAMAIILSALSFLLWVRLKKQTGGNRSMLAK